MVQWLNDNDKIGCSRTGMDEILFYVTQSLEALQVQKQFTEFCWEMVCIVVYQ